MENDYTMEGEEKFFETQGKAEFGMREDSKVELSLCSIVEVTGYRALKMKGSIHGREVVVLIDSGATHTFIAVPVVQELQLQVKPTEQFCVIFGNGQKVLGEGVCEKIPLQLPGITVVQNFFPFQLGRVDVVLGVEWLWTLGEITANWQNMYIKLKLADQKIVL